MNKQVRNGVALGLLALSVWNCKVADPEPSPYESGVYILNAGNFSQNNGTISFLQRGGTSVATSIFQTANPSLSLQGGVQGYTEVDGKGLILVDNSTAGQDKVEIVEVGTFKTRATLRSPDIENPRQVVQAGPNKAYVSCWDVSGDFSKGTFYKDPGYVAVVNLNTSTVSKKIPAVKGAEGIVVIGSEAFVGGNAYSGNKTLLIIDTNTDEVKQRIETFGSAPEPIAVDSEGKLWLREGRDMIRMNPTSRLIEKRLTFPSAPGSVTIGNDKKTFFYTMNGRTYRFGTTDTNTGSVVVGRSFSALGVDPQTNVVYASVIPSYAQAGYVLRYQNSGTTLTLVDSVRAEIAPSGFFFR